MAISHRIVVMNKGKIDQIGTPAEIYDDPQTLHVASFIGEMNFIKKDGKIIAVRPEDIEVLPAGEGDLEGEVRTIMLLGHYVVLTVQHGENAIMCNIDRAQSETLDVGDKISLKLGKHSIFDHAPDEV